MTVDTKAAPQIERRQGSLRIERDRHALLALCDLAEKNELALPTYMVRLRAELEQEMR